MRTRDFLFVVGAAALWGGGGVIGKLLGDHADLHPMSVAALRLAAGGLVLVAALAAVGKLPVHRFGRAAWIRIVATAAFAAVFEASYYSAIALTSVGFSTLVAIGSTPVMVALYEWARGQRPRAAHLAALGLALAGLGALTSGSLALGSGALAGGALALLTGASFAGISIVNRTPVPGLDPMALTGVSFVIGAVMLMPLAAAAGWGLPSDATGWTLLVVLGVVVTAVAYVLFLRGLETVPPAVATVVTLLEPLTAAVLGWLVFAEWLGWWGVAGGLALATAVVLLRPQREGASAAA